MYVERKRETDRQTKRDRDRLTDRQTDRQKQRERERKRERETETETERDRDKDTERVHNRICAGYPDITIGAEKYQQNNLYMEHDVKMCVCVFVSSLLVSVPRSVGDLVKSPQVQQEPLSLAEPKIGRANQGRITLQSNASKI